MRTGNMDRCLFLGKEVEEWFEAFEEQEITKNKKANGKLEGKMVGDMETQFWRGYLQRGLEVLGEVAKEAQVKISCKTKEGGGNANVG